MRATSAIMLNTFREVVRNRMFILLLLVAGGLTTVVLALGSVSLNQEKRVVIDVGFFLISTLVALLSTILSGAMVHNELERKTIYTLISKPIHRWQFLLGKYLGIGLSSGLMVVVLGGLLAACYWLVDGQLNGTFVKALFLIWVEVVTLCGVSLFFVSFSTPMLSSFLTIGVLIGGRFVPTLQEFRFKDGGEGTVQLEALVHGMAKVLPDLSLYNLTPSLVYESPVSFAYVFESSVAGLSYAMLYLVAAMFIFGQRDLT